MNPLDWHFFKLLSLRLIGLFLILNNSMLSGQTLEVAESYRQKAKAFIDENQRDSVEYYFMQAIETVKEVPDASSRQIASFYLDLASFYTTYSQVEKSKATFQQVKPYIDSIELIEQEDFAISGRYYESFGNYYNRIAYLDSAALIWGMGKDILIKSPKLDSSAYARALSNLGIVNYNMRNLEEAWAYEEEAFEIKKRILDPDDYAMATSYKMLGIRLIEDSHSVDQAIEYLKESLRITEKNWGEKNPNTLFAMQLLIMGYDVAQEDENALALALKVLDLQFQTGQEVDINTAELYSQIAGILRDLGRLDESLDYFKRYEETSNQIQNADMRYPDAVAYTGLSMLYSEIGEFDLSEEYVDRAKGFWTQLAGPDHPILANVYNQISTIHWQKNEIDKALASIDKAIAVNSYEKGIFKGEIIPLSWLAKYPQEYAVSHIQRTEILFDKYFLSTEDSILDKAWHSFEMTETLLEDALTKQKNITDIETLQMLNDRLYSSAIEMLWRQNDLNPDQGYFEQMWNYSERSKAINQKLRERKRQVALLGEIPTEIIEEETAINKRIDKYRSFIINGNTSDSIQSSLFQAQLDKKKFEAKVKSDFPTTHQLIYAIDSLDVNEVKKITKDKRVVVDYFMSKKHLFAFTLSQNKIGAYRLDTPVKRIIDEILAFSSALSSGSNKDYFGSAHMLYKSLFEPFEDDLIHSDVIIIPNKELWNLNFDLLLSSSPLSKDYSKYDFLIKSYSFSYANSISLLTKESVQKKSPQPLLALAYSQNIQASGDLKNLRDAPKSNLPGTAKEVQSLSNSIKGDFYYGNEANESVFKKTASDYRILHLALHGEVNEANPDQSKLYFTPDSSMKSEDNILYTFELYNMRLNADLAILSACNTGVGSIKNGEGIMSLGKAFQYAGVKSVLLSQWEVSDAVTPVIMSSFYENLKAGQSKSQALRQAKLEFLENSNNITSNPYYWGSFFIIGDPSPVNLDFTNQRLYWIFGLLLLTALFVYRRLGAQSHNK